MAELCKKVKFALDEARILVLGSQVLLGIHFRSFLESRFDQFPAYVQLLNFAGLILMLAALLLLVLPAAHHRIVEEGDDTVNQHQFTTDVMDFALLPFALGLGIDCFVAFHELFAPAYAMAAGIIATSSTLFCWYGLPWLIRARRKTGGSTMKDESARTPLDEKIEHVLTECRVVLPGVQALLGFQFTTMLMEGFQKLPESSQQVHLASLCLIALAMVLLIMPAARHRIVEEGELTEEFHRFASLTLLAALVPVALGMAGELFVITRKLTGSMPAGTTAACLSAGAFLAVWFGVMIWLRKRRLTKRK